MDGQRKHFETIVIIMTLTGAILDFFYTLLIALETVYNMPAHEAMTWSLCDVSGANRIQQVKCVPPGE